MALHSLLSGFISTRVRLWSVDMSQQTCDLICWTRSTASSVLSLRCHEGHMPQNNTEQPNIITKCCSFCGAIVTLSQKNHQGKVHKVHSCLSHIFLLPSKVDPRILRLPSSKAQRICNWPYLRKSWIGCDWLCQLAIQVVGNQCALIIPDLPSGYLT